MVYNINDTGHVAVHNAIAATLAATITTATAAATYVSQRDVAKFTDPGLTIGARQLTLLRGTPGTFDSDAVESQFPFWDESSGRWASVYSGYGTPTGGQEASVGLAFSDDLLTWVKSGQVFNKSGAGADSNGTSGPVVWFENGVYTLFYIGLTADGYEAGNKTIMAAQNTLPPAQWTTANWTRLGAQIAISGSGWRSIAVWHVSIVKRGAIYYNFFNATGADNIERTGYATASAITGPWTVDDVNSPIIAQGTGTQWDAGNIGDPSVYRTHEGWIMHYYGTNNPTTQAADGVAQTTDELFPLGWTKHPNPILTPGPSNGFDGLYAHKPIIVQHGGRAFHFYTAVDKTTNRQCAVTVSPSAIVAAPVTGISTSIQLRNLISALAQQKIITDLTPIVSDTFTRANSSTSLGNADTGQTWAQSAGVFGVLNNQAYVVSGTPQALISSVVPAGQVSMTVLGTMPAAGQAVGMLLRYQSSSVYYELDIQGSGAIELDQFNSGATNVASNAGAGFVSGDVLSVHDDGTQLIVQRNGVTVLTYATTLAASATQSGMRVYAANSALIDNFQVRGR